MALLLLSLRLRTLPNVFLACLPAVGSVATVLILLLLLSEAQAGTTHATHIGSGGIRCEAYLVTDDIFKAKNPQRRELPEKQVTEEGQILRTVVVQHRTIFGKWVNISRITDIYTANTHSSNDKDEAAPTRTEQIKEIWNAANKAWKPAQHTTFINDEVEGTPIVAEVERWNVRSHRYENWRRVWYVYENNRLTREINEEWSHVRNAFQLMLDSATNTTGNATIN